MAACVGASVCKLTIYINKRGAWGYNIEPLRSITMKIQLASSENIDAWMALVEQVRDAFPSHCSAIHPRVFRHLCIGGRTGRGCPAVLKGKQRAVLSGSGPRP